MLVTCASQVDPCHKASGHHEGAAQQDTVGDTGDHIVVSGAGNQRSAAGQGAGSASVIVEVAGDINGDVVSASGHRTIGGAVSGIGC